jgi:hypothetical protein
VDVEIITEEANANALYDEATHNLKYRTPMLHLDANRILSVEKEQALKEYYASVRMNVCTVSLHVPDAPYSQVLLTWIVSNVSH